MLFCVCIWNDACKFKEASLHRRGNTVAESYLADNFDSVDIIELDMFFSNHILHACRKFCIHFLDCPRRVEKESSAVFQVGYHIVFEHV